MRHIILSKYWEYNEEPFPAYRCELIFGRNKRDREFLPMKNIAPDPEEQTLPEGQFRVIKTKEKGTILVVPGSETTNRCLLFVGCSGGFRGGVRILEDGTDENVILKTCVAGNNCESRAEVVALLKEGESVTFQAFGRRVNQVYQYTWNGEEVEEKSFSASEWSQRHEVSSTPEDAEVL